MPTSASGTVAYCTREQFLERYDWRSVAQLLSDTTNPLTQQQVTSSNILENLLMQASGEVEAACLVSNRYVISGERNDLAALTGNSAALLVGLVADLAMWHLFRRRPLRDPGMKPPSAVEEARELLDQLRKGERIFGWVENAEAGLIDSRRETPEDVKARNGIATLASRFFGRRGNQYLP